MHDGKSRSSGVVRPLEIPLRASSSPSEGEHLADTFRRKWVFMSLQSVPLCLTQSQTLHESSRRLPLRPNGVLSSTRGDTGGPSTVCTCTFTNVASVWTSARGASQRPEVSETQRPEVEKSRLAPRAVEVR